MINNIKRFRKIDVNYIDLVTLIQISTLKKFLRKFAEYIPETNRTEYIL